MHGGGGALKLEAKKLGSKAARENAFTLAEVLITLAIIGVVSALTIPTVVAKYQKKQLYTQFMKTFNTLSNAFSLAETENGSYDTWGIVDNGANNQSIFESNLLSYLKISKTCTSASDCNANSVGNVTALNYNGLSMPYSNALSFTKSNEKTTVILQDGALIEFSYTDSDLVAMNIDINGAQKGPNQIGRDMLSLNYEKDNGKWQLIPLGTADDMNSDDEYTNCTTEKSSIGNYCSYRLLTEGKMDY